jgi:hypothetical protein
MANSRGIWMMGKKALWFRRFALDQRTPVAKKTRLKDSSRLRSSDSVRVFTRVPGPGTSPA